MAEGSAKPLEGKLAKECLVAIDGIARDQGDSLASKYPEWPPIVSSLADLKIRTYFPILAIALVARSLRPEQGLDVLAIQKGSSPRGYSASSIGGHLIPFTREQNVDLRSESPGVMNNQPFTFKPRILPTYAEMLGKDREDKNGGYAFFYEALLKVQKLRPEQAKEVAALLFHLRRADETSDEQILLWGGRETFQRMITALDDFVSNNSDNGKVGQAVVAAALSVTYPHDDARTKGVHDPSFGFPGDVAVGPAKRPWLYAEARQKGQSTEDVNNFVEKAKDGGADRVWFAALGNFRYPGYISVDHVLKRSEALGVGLEVFQSTRDLLEFVARAGPGELDSLSSKLVTETLKMLKEQRCEPETIDAYRSEVIAKL